MEYWSKGEYNLRKELTREGAGYMSTMEATISMMEVLPEDDLVQICNFTTMLYEKRKVNNPFVPLTEEKLMSDLETSRTQIAQGKSLNMKTALEQLGAKYGI
jgi:EAL domain-containing protein (putative c-di-GMP-specific phosphodiesterase class I)